MSAQFAPFPVDQYSTADYSSVVGMEIEAPDEDALTPGATPTINSNAKRKIRLVQNGSGGTFTGGDTLAYVATHYRTQVQKSANGAAIRGAVPYTIFGSKTQTIPNLAYFWMIVKGPTKVKTDGNAITEGDLLETGATNGCVKTDATALAANKSVLGGTAMASAAARGTGAQVYVQVDLSCDI